MAASKGPSIWRRASLGLLGRKEDTATKSQEKDNSKAVRDLLSSLLTSDETKAIQLYTAVDKAGDSLEFEMHPSLPISNSGGGDGHNLPDNTPLHYAAGQNMGRLFMLFMEHGGLPNTLNAQNQTCLHAACGGLVIHNRGFNFRSILKGAANLWSGLKSSAVSRQQQQQQRQRQQQQRRRSGKSNSLGAADKEEEDNFLTSGGDKQNSISGGGCSSHGGVMTRGVSTADAVGVVEEAGQLVSVEERAGRSSLVRSLLEWRGLEIDGACETTAVNAVDASGNTALHYAARHGLVEACALLLGPEGHAILTVVNREGETPCELAGGSGFTDLASALEALMLFEIDLPTAVVAATSIGAAFASMATHSPVATGDAGSVHARQHEVATQEHSSNTIKGSSDGTNEHSTESETNVRMKESATGTTSTTRVKNGAEIVAEAAAAEALETMKAAEIPEANSNTDTFTTLLFAPIHEDNDDLSGDGDENVHADDEHPVLLLAKTRLLVAAHALDNFDIFSSQGLQSSSPLSSSAPDSEAHTRLSSLPSSMGCTNGNTVASTGVQGSDCEADNDSCAEQHNEYGQFLVAVAEHFLAVCSWDVDEFSDRLREVFHVASALNEEEVDEMEHGGGGGGGGGSGENGDDHSNGYHNDETIDNRGPLFEDLLSAAKLSRDSWAKVCARGRDLKASTQPHRDQIITSNKTAPTSTTTSADKNADGRDGYDESGDLVSPATSSAAKSGWAWLVPGTAVLVNVSGGDDNDKDINRDDETNNGELEETDFMSGHFVGMLGSLEDNSAGDGDRNNVTEEGTTSATTASTGALTATMTAVVFVDEIGEEIDVSLSKIKHSILSHPSPLSSHEREQQQPQEQVQERDHETEQESRGRVRSCVVCGDSFPMLKQTPSFDITASSSPSPSSASASSSPPILPALPGKDVAAAIDGAAMLHIVENSGCGHGFCVGCWGGYLRVQLREGGGAVPVCAAHGCSFRVRDHVATIALRSIDVADDDNGGGIKNKGHGHEKGEEIKKENKKNTMNENSVADDTDDGDRAREGEVLLRRWYEVRVEAVVEQAHDLSYCPCKVKVNRGSCKNSPTGGALVASPPTTNETRSCGRILRRDMDCEGGGSWRHRRMEKEVQQRLTAARNSQQQQEQQQQQQQQQTLQQQQQRQSGFRGGSGGRDRGQGAADGTDEVGNGDLLTLVQALRVSTSPNGLPLNSLASGSSAVTAATADQTPPLLTSPLPLPSSQEAWSSWSQASKLSNAYCEACGQGFCWDPQCAATFSIGRNTSGGCGGNSSNIGGGNDQAFVLNAAVGERIKSEPHAPCPCHAWAEWKTAVHFHVKRAREEAAKLNGQKYNQTDAAENEFDDDDDEQDLFGDGGESGTSGSAIDMGNLLWLAANTKRCPQCQTATEKNEGCNHMTCKKCRHEYCWICMEDWRIHSNSTGGYYRCNRFNDEQAEQVATDLASSSGTNTSHRENNGNLLSNGVSQENRGRGSAADEARRVATEAKDAARFVHHFTRFRAQEESSNMEKKRKTGALARVRALHHSKKKFEHTSSSTNSSSANLSIAHTAATAMKNRSRSYGGDQTLDQQEGFGGGEAWGLLTKGVPAAVLRGALLKEPHKLLKDAFEELARCRLVLRNSFVFVFYVLANEALESVSSAHAHSQAVHACTQQLGLRQSQRQPSKARELNYLKQELHTTLYASARFASGVATVSARLRRSGKNALKSRRSTIELQQSELEMLTESLSDIVARRFMRASCREIRNATRVARLKRSHFFGTLLDFLRRPCVSDSEALKVASSVIGGASSTSRGFSRSPFYNRSGSSGNDSGGGFQGGFGHSQQNVANRRSGGIGSHGNHDWLLSLRSFSGNNDNDGAGGGGGELASPQQNISNRRSGGIGNEQERQDDWPLSSSLSTSTTSLHQPYLHHQPQQQLQTQGGGGGGGANVGGNNEYDADEDEDNIIALLLAMEGVGFGSDVVSGGGIGDEAAFPASSPALTVLPHSSPLSLPPPLSPQLLLPSVGFGSTSGNSGVGKNVENVASLGAAEHGDIGGGSINESVTMANLATPGDNDPNLESIEDNSVIAEEEAMIARAIQESLKGDASLLLRGNDTTNQQAVFDPMPPQPPGCHALSGPHAGEAQTTLAGRPPEILSMPMNDDAGTGNDNDDINNADIGGGGLNGNASVQRQNVDGGGSESEKSGELDEGGEQMEGEEEEDFNGSEVSEFSDDEDDEEEENIDDEEKERDNEDGEHLQANEESGDSGLPDFLGEIAALSTTSQSLPSLLPPLPPASISAVSSDEIDVDHHRSYSGSSASVLLPAQGVVQDDDTCSGWNGGGSDNTVDIGEHVSSNDEGVEGWVCTICTRVNTFSDGCCVTCRYQRGHQLSASDDDEEASSI